MSFIVAGMNECAYTSEINTKNFQLMIMSNRYQQANAKLSDYLSEDGADNEDKTAVRLQAIVEEYDTQKEQLQNELEALQANKESIAKLVDNGIKDGCKFTLSV